MKTFSCQDVILHYCTKLRPGSRYLYGDSKETLYTKKLTEVSHFILITILVDRKTYFIAWQTDLFAEAQNLNMKT